MEKEINLKNLFVVIRRRLWIIVVLTIVSAAIGGAYSIFLKTPLYSSSARMLILADENEMITLKAMINEPAVLEKVAAKLQANRPASALSGQITVENVLGSQIIKITVVDSDPALAVKIANTTMNVFKQEAAKILDFKNVDILTEAKPQEYPVPININHQQSIMTFLLAGLVVSIGIVFLLDSLDDAVKSERAIEKVLEIPVLGSISKMNKKNIRGNEKAKEAVSLEGKVIDS
ncbi:Wzz/FepE/Etk N-terminal domain-containing protein [Ectobacillus funiculus]|uniref:YveK family protein n=1 Tax=Ectobacillus funiculus TaxID=137993 RepID=UPI00397D8787